MLRRNIDTKAGLVNGVIGTVCSVSSSCVTVQFDHTAEPYDVQQIKSKFMLMKSFYVYRMQFPLILAFAVTIHKCQGLSLDSAIIDLSDQVFAAGMAFVPWPYLGCGRFPGCTGSQGVQHQRPVPEGGELTERDLPKGPQVVLHPSATCGQKAQTYRLRPAV